VDAIEKDGFEAHGLHTAIAEDAENPEEPCTMFGLVLQACEELVHAFGRFPQIVARQSNFQGSARTRRSLALMAVLSKFASEPFCTSSWPYQPGTFFSMSSMAPS